ncbi:uncharacterized protein B0I36DRAFT_325039 [Microdochium trichocladiopsis]|uniref:Thioesterase domain-containing protein n=1 Tax=Microdochium trichocladiopsis TaxID=1682393 RepID=A0A9P9BPC4_9PEZI|nr:uncharacterized protein B0I36DRAFT_325039 [Microdochium trichocladiopsis]KAH7029097.1 hypothetical protein B0I36DRAFT_325039 [Microdochium trichocladiopsis]
MARHYIGLVEACLPDGGDILLGGWSLGGTLSLEMAHQIAVSGPEHLRKKFRVVGMVWVDTVFPHHVEGETQDTYVGPNERIAEVTQDMIDDMTNQQLVQLNMMHARRMVYVWDIPAWEKAEDKNGERAVVKVQPPRTILLRAKGSTKGDSPSFVDRTRQFRMLGWEKYSAAHGGFIDSVVDVEGEHFTVFEFDKIEDITAHIRRAADELERRTT